MATSISEPNTEENLLTATFRLGDDGIFGIDATLIQEVIMVGDLTPVRHAPAFVAGVRNLRGRIITIIDLGIRLGIEPVLLGIDTRILIADWKGEPVGLLVDEVADAIEVEDGALEPAPPNLHGVQMQKMLGVFHSGQRLAALLDLTSVLGPDDQAIPSISNEQ